MRRRELILGSGAALTVPYLARAQQKLRVVGYLSGTHPGIGTCYDDSIRRGLSDVGYIDAQNVTFEYRWAEGQLDRMPALATELVRIDVDVIIMIDGLSGALAVKSATSTIPVVFLVGVDPVSTGVVANLARPGGNLTGVTTFGATLTAKRIELLAEVAPRVQVIAVLGNSRNAAFSPAQSSTLLHEIAQARGIDIELVSAGAETEFEAAFKTIVAAGAGALLVAADPLFSNHQDQIVALAARYSVPTLYVAREFVEAGGLISYGPELSSLCRQIGVYAGRVLKGERPGDLPVQQPSKFELTVNLKAAKSLGLVVPQSILAHADDVLE